MEKEPDVLWRRKVLIRSKSLDTVFLGVMARAVKIFTIPVSRLAGGISA